MADCLEHGKVDGDKFIEQSDIRELESKLKDNVIGTIDRNQRDGGEKDDDKDENSQNNKPIEENIDTKTAEQSKPNGDKEIDDKLLSSTTTSIKNCDNCKKYQIDLEQAKAEKIELEKQLSALKKRIQTINGELEREVQRRCEMEQKFTEEAKRSTDQIDELISKSNQDDVRLSELNRKFDLYSHETSAMIESFTTNREVLTSQLLQLRQENDYLLGKYIGRSRDLQNEEINLPQTVDELQFHCLTLNEKLILATLAKEQLEETLMQNTSHTIN